MRFNFIKNETNPITEWPTKPTIMLRFNSTYKDNKSRRRAALFELVDLPWMWFRVENNVIFDNNFGTILNDVYVQNIRRLDYINSFWMQDPKKSELPMNPA